MLSASIVVTSYNSRHLLAKNLASIIQAGNYANAAEIIVVDDASSDGTCDFLRATYPMVRLVPLKVNQGFAGAANAGIQVCKTDVIVLLNSDMSPQSDFLPPLLSHFQDEKVFAVMAQQLVPTLSGPIFRSAQHGQFKRGFFRQAFETSHEKFHETAPTFFASGGGSAFRRQYLAQLGGFDRLYDPFYWEDVDLSLRAWRRGLRVLFEPSSMITHEESSTIGRLYSFSRVAAISSRNAWLMAWKNALDRELILNHFGFVVPNLAGSLLRGHFYVLTGFCMALARLPLALKRRRIEWQERLLDDRSILRQF